MENQARITYLLQGKPTRSQCMPYCGNWDVFSSPLLQCIVQLVQVGTWLVADQEEGVAIIAVAGAALKEESGQAGHQHSLESGFGNHSLREGLQQQRAWYQAGWLLNQNSSAPVLMSMHWWQDLGFSSTWSWDLWTMENLQCEPLLKWKISTWCRF